MILCTFEDGTAERRPADSSATAAGGSFRLWMLRGDPTAQVPRGGEWVPCRVETSDDQIDRLTRERDAAVAHAARWKRLAKRLRFVLAGAEQDIGHLRRGATAMLAALSSERTDVKPSSLGASLVVWAEYVRRLVAKEG